MIPVLGLAVLGLAALAGSEAAAEPAAVKRLRLEGATLVAVVLPHPVRDWVLPGGGERLVLRTAEPDGDPAYHAVELADPPLVRSLSANLPAAAGALFAVDLDADGEEEVLVATADGVWVLPTGGRPAARVLATSLHQRPLAVRSRQAVPSDALVLLGVGRLITFSPLAGQLVDSVELALPVRAQRRAAGLELDSPAVTLVPREGRAPYFLVGPEPHGNRLRTVLLDPSAPAEERATESWARLPGAEEVQESWYVLVDGRPRLVVTTNRSDKLGIFEKKALRVFPVAPDRSRAGRPPLLAVATESPRWHRIEIAVEDLDGDGRDDLVVLQPEGMSGKKLLLSAYTAAAGSGRPSFRSRLELDGGCWAYGEDVVGDEAADLAVFDGLRLDLYPGLVRPEKGRLIERQPALSLALAGEGAAVTTTVSLGSDGLDEESSTECSLHLARRRGERRGAVLLARGDRFWILRAD